MKIENICFWVVIAVFFFFSCNKEVEPNFLSGKYSAYYFEIQDCSDTNQNYTIDLNFPDSIYKLNCILDTISCDSVFEMDSSFVRVNDFTPTGMDTFYFELDTVVLDTVVECLTQLIECDDVKYNEITFEIDEVGNYEFVFDRVFNGVNEVNVDKGNYYSSGFNDINFCLTDCLDSLWHPGVFVFSRGDLNLSWRDTISTNCGYLFQGDSIQ